MGNLTALPRPHSWIKGSLLLRKEDGREWREEEGEEWRGKGVSGRKGDRGKGKVRVEGPSRYAPAVA